MKNKQSYTKPAFLVKADAVFNFIVKVAFWGFLAGILATIAFKVLDLPAAVLTWALCICVVCAFLYITISLSHGMMTQAFEDTLQARMGKGTTVEAPKKKKGAKAANDGKSAVEVALVDL